MLNYHSGFIFKQFNLLTHTATPKTHTSEVSGLCLSCIEIQSGSSVCIRDLSFQGQRATQQETGSVMANLSQPD